MSNSSGLKIATETQRNSYNLSDLDMPSQDQVNQTQPVENYDTASLPDVSEVNVQEQALEENKAPLAQIGVVQKTKAQIEAETLQEQSQETEIFRSVDFEGSRFAGVAREAAENLYLNRESKPAASESLERDSIFLGIAAAEIKELAASRMASQLDRKGIARNQSPTVRSTLAA